MIGQDSVFISKPAWGGCLFWGPECGSCSGKSPFRGTEGMAQQLGDMSSSLRTGIKKPDMAVHAGKLSAVGVETGGGSLGLTGQSV